MPEAKVQVCVRLEPALYQQATKIAKRQSLTITAFVAAALEAEVARANTGGKS